MNQYRVHPLHGVDIVVEADGFDQTAETVMFYKSAQILKEDESVQIERAFVALFFIQKIVGIERVHDFLRPKYCRN